MTTINFNTPLNSHTSTQFSGENLIDQSIFLIPPLPNEIVFLISSHLNHPMLIRMSQISRAWEAVFKPFNFNNLTKLYTLIWQEWPPFSGDLNHLQSIERAFEKRFCFTRLNVIGDELNLSISALAQNIVQIRQMKSEWASTPETCRKYMNSDFWIEKIQTAKNETEKYYAMRELGLIYHTKGKLPDLQNYLFNSLVSANEANQKLFFELFSYFASPEKIQEFALKHPHAFLPIVLRLGLLDIINTYLKNQSNVIIHDAPHILAQAARWQQFEIMQKLLDHSPSLPCYHPQHLNQTTALHQLCSLDEKEIDAAKWQQWQALVQQLMHRGCSLLQSDEQGLTPLHRAHHKGNKKFLNFFSFVSLQIAIKNRAVQDLGFILKNSSLNKESLLELKKYFSALLEKEEIDFLNDSKVENKEEIKILRLLLQVDPSLIKEFDLSLECCYHPWMLPVFIQLIDRQDPLTQQIYRLKLFEAVLKTPFIFIDDLLSNYSEEDLAFLSSEITAYMTLFHRQMNHLFPAGIHADQTLSEYILKQQFLSLNNIQKHIHAEVQDKDIADTLYEICKKTYRPWIKKSRALLTSHSRESPAKRQRLHQ